MEDITGPTQHVTTQVPASKLRKGNLLLMNNRPHILRDFCQTKVGKHGFAKAKLGMIDLTDLRKYDDVMKASTLVHVMQREVGEVQTVSISLDDTDEQTQTDEQVEGEAVKNNTVSKYILEIDVIEDFHAKVKIPGSVSVPSKLQTLRPKEHWMLLLE